MINSIFEAVIQVGYLHIFVNDWVCGWFCVVLVCSQWHNLWNIFLFLFQVLADPVARQQHGYEAMLLLTILVNYRKYEVKIFFFSFLTIVWDWC